MADRSSTATTEILKRLAGVTEDPRQYLLEWKRRNGKKVIACLPMHVPEEIIQAAGMLPVVLQGSDEPITLADGYIHPYLCHPIRSNFDVALRGELDFADGLVIPDICDQATRVGSAWRLYHSIPFFHYLRFPKMMDVPGSKEYLVRELQRFKVEVEKFSGQKVSDESLRQSLALFSRTRSLLAELYRLRRQSPGSFSTGEVATIVTASMIMLKEEYNSLLEQYLSLKQGEGSKRDGTRLIVVGNPCEDLDPGFADVIDEVGGLVVDDDLYPGSKYFASPVAQGASPLEALADAYLQGRVCPTKHEPKKPWADHVFSIAKEAQAKGVVVLFPKFCEIYYFEYPELKSRLSQDGIPHLLLETDHTGAIAPARTRLQAFIEMIGGQ